MEEIKKVYLFLAEGFEEIEALTVVDMLRRAGILIETVSITGDKTVTASHAIPLQADKKFEDCDFSDASLLVLPGGMPGTKYLGEYEPLRELLLHFYKEGGRIAAICAAPTVLSSLGLLKGRKATCYPSRMAELECSEVSEETVVVDGNITTSRSMGTAIDFSLSLIQQLVSQEKAAEIAASICYL